MPGYPIRLLFLAIVLAGPISFAVPAGQFSDVADGAVRSEEQVTTPPAGAWRRTAQGWQQTARWPRRHEPHNTSPLGRVHPVLLATLIALLSLAALIGFGSPHNA